MAATTTAIWYILNVFEWDPRKASTNADKHANALEGPDLSHSAREARYLRLGRSSTERVLIVAYTVRRHDDAQAIRIISARLASRRERTAYTAQD